MRNSRSSVPPGPTAYPAPLTHRARAAGVPRMPSPVSKELSARDSEREKAGTSTMSCSDTGSREGNKAGRELGGRLGRTEHLFQTRGGGTHMEQPAARSPAGTGVSTSQADQSPTSGQFHGPDEDSGLHTRVGGSRRSILGEINFILQGRTLRLRGAKWHAQVDMEPCQESSLMILC